MCRARLGVLVGGLALSACAGEHAATQLDVRVIDGSDGRLQIPAELDAFEIRVATVEGGLDGGLARVRFRRTYRLAPLGGGGVTLPQSLAIVPDPVGGTGTVRVDVLGLKHGRVLQRITRNASFGIGRVTLPPFALTPLCFGVVCPEGQTCELDGTCRAIGDLPDAGTGPCGSGLVACGDRCMPYDDANCGACGSACPAGERCIANVCACAVGLARCGDACVDLSSDPSQCGACGTVCAASGATDLVCASGACVITACVAGRGDCNADAADGCETSLESDASSCGACGNVCAFTRGAGVCSAGSCALAGCDFGYADCDGSDANGCETPSTCGGDGAGCTTSCGTTGTTQCVAGGCDIECREPSEICNLIDEDCDGRCDDGAGCRTPVHRSSNGSGIHCYGTGSPSSSCAGYTVEFSPYFFVYGSALPGLATLYRCDAPSGNPLLSTSAGCDGGTMRYVAGYIATSATTCRATPLYHLYNVSSQDHFYTVSASERDTAVGLGWSEAGILGYVWTSADE